MPAMYWMMVVGGANKSGDSTIKKPVSYADLLVH